MSISRQEISTFTSLDSRDTSKASNHNVRKALFAVVTAVAALLAGCKSTSTTPDISSAAKVVTRTPPPPDAEFEKRAEWVQEWLPRVTALVKYIEQQEAPFVQRHASAAMYDGSPQDPSDDVSVFRTTFSGSAVEDNLPEDVFNELPIEYHMNASRIIEYYWDQDTWLTGQSEEHITATAFINAFSHGDARWEEVGNEQECIIRLSLADGSIIHFFYKLGSVWLPPNGKVIPKEGDFGVGVNCVECHIDGNLMVPNVRQSFSDEEQLGELLTLIRSQRTPNAGYVVRIPPSLISTLQKRVLDPACVECHTDGFPVTAQMSVGTRVFLGEMPPKSDFSLQQKEQMMEPYEGNLRSHNNGDSVPVYVDGSGRHVLLEEGQEKE